MIARKQKATTLPPLISNRLTAIGPPKTLQRFLSAEADWIEKLQAQHLELFCVEKSRCTWWFNTRRSIVPLLKELSQTWSSLTFLLAWEDEDQKLIALMKAKNGKADLCQFTY